MELTEIIYNVLMLASFTFFIVLLFSYLISKSKTNIKPNFDNSDQQQKVRIKSQQIIDTQNIQREKQISDFNERMHYSNKINKSLKMPNIIRISTAKNSTLTIEEIEERKKNGNGSRYSIINEKINKVKIKAANFYL